MWDSLVVGERRKRGAVVHSGPPATQLYVVVLVGTVRHPVVRQVRQHEQKLAQTSGHQVSRFAGHSFVVTERPTPRRQLLGRDVVLVAARLAHLAREFLHFGAKPLGLLEELAMLDIEGYRRIHLGRRDPTPGESGPHDVGFAAELNQVNHGLSLPRRYWRPRRTV